MATHKYSATETSITWTITNIVAKEYKRTATMYIKDLMANKIAVVKGTLAANATSLTMTANNTKISAVFKIAAGKRYEIRMTLIPESGSGTTVSYAARNIVTPYNEWKQGTIKMSTNALNETMTFDAKMDFCAKNIVTRKLHFYASVVDAEGNAKCSDVLIDKWTIQGDAGVKAFRSFEYRHKKTAKYAEFSELVKKGTGKGTILKLTAVLILNFGLNGVEQTYTLKTYAGPVHFTTGFANPAFSFVTEEDSIKATVDFIEQKTFNRYVSFLIRKNADSEYELIKSYVKVPKTGNSASCTFEGLQPNQAYDIKAKVYCEYTYKDEVKKALALEKTTTKSTSEVSGSVESVSPSFGTITVHLGNLEDTTGRTLEMWSNENGNGWKLRSIVELTENVSGYECIYDELTNGSSYNLKIEIHGADGRLLKTLYVGTYKPASQTGDSPESAGRDSATISWNVNTESTAEDISCVVSYKGAHDIYYKDFGGVINTVGVTNEKRSMSCVIEGLAPDTDYDYKIRVMKGERFFGTLNGRFKTEPLNGQITIERVEIPPDRDIVKVQHDLPVQGTMQVLKRGAGVWDVCKALDEVPASGTTFPYADLGEWTDGDHMMFRYELHTEGEGTYVAESNEMDIFVDRLDWEGDYFSGLKWRKLIDLLKLSSDDEGIRNLTIADGDVITADFFNAIVDGFNVRADCNFAKVESMDQIDDAVLEEMAAKANWERGN